LLKNPTLCLRVEAAIRELEKIGRFSQKYLSFPYDSIRYSTQSAFVAFRDGVFGEPLQQPGLTCSFQRVELYSWGCVVAGRAVPAEFTHPYVSNLLSSNACTFYTLIGKFGRLAEAQQFLPNVFFEEYWNTCALAAASAGHLDLLDWCHANNRFPPDCNILDRELIAALESGNYKVADWLVTRFDLGSARWELRCHHLAGAIRSKYERMVEWLLGKDCCTCHIYVWGLHMHSFMDKEHGCPLEAALEIGDIELFTHLLKRRQAKGGALKPFSLLKAAIIGFHGRAAIMDEVLALSGGPASELDFTLLATEAASEGCVEALTWISSNHHPFNFARESLDIARVGINAAQKGFHDVLAWLSGLKYFKIFEGRRAWNHRKKDFEGFYDILLAAIGHGRVKTVRWLLDHPTAPLSADRLSISEGFRYHKTEASAVAEAMMTVVASRFDPSFLFEAAINHRNDKACRWLAEQGCTIPSSAFRAVLSVIKEEGDDAIPFLKVLVEGCGLCLSAVTADEVDPSTGFVARKNVLEAASVRGTRALIDFAQSLGCALDGIEIRRVQLACARSNNWPLLASLAKDFPHLPKYLSEVASNCGGEETAQWLMKYQHGAAAAK
jgi:hypothetical protein